MNQRVLYITYDGLTDPLGQSQILPYLSDLASPQRVFTILSFEKRARFETEAATIRALLAPHKINWVPLSFTRRPRYLAKAWDLIRMYTIAFCVAYRKNITVVHCRSYQASQVGRFLKKTLGVQMIFDMRGFWADERVDGGLWRKASFLQNALYRFYKSEERRMLASADQIITLTEASLPYLREWSPGRLPVTVIPCCADFEHFSPALPESRARVRESLGLSPSNVVLTYLGSLGTWYMLEQMLELFAELRKQTPDARFLFVTQDWEDRHDRLATEYGLNRSDICVRAARRTDVPALLGACDLAISFIKPCFSKVASSPTKLGEYWAMGLPVITNGGVGDVEHWVNELQAGVVVKSFDEQGYREAIAELPALLAANPGELRERARKQFSLSRASAGYHDVYRKVADRVSFKS